MKPIESSLLPVCWRKISLWLKIWKLGRYFFQLKLLLHHFAAQQRELKWLPKVYRISCHCSLVLLLQMDCSLHSSWLPALISFVLLQLFGAPTIYDLVYQWIIMDMISWREGYGSWRVSMKNCYALATDMFTSSRLVLLGYWIFLVTCLTLSRLIWNVTIAPFFDLAIQHFFLLGSW